jgi:hypothetical protein
MNGAMKDLYEEAGTPTNREVENYMYVIGA